MQSFGVPTLVRAEGVAMKVEVGDKVLLRSHRDPSGYEETEYTVLEICEDFIKVKHPKIGGYFGVKHDSVVEVINESR